MCANIQTSIGRGIATGNKPRKAKLPTLRELVAEQRAELDYYATAFTDFRALLHGPKFTGFGNAWISTEDVLHWLRNVERESKGGAK
jgi:hypothetical protein